MRSCGAVQPVNITQAVARAKPRTKAREPKLLKVALAVGSRHMPSIYICATLCCLGLLCGRGIGWQSCASSMQACTDDESGAPAAPNLLQELSQQVSCCQLLLSHHVQQCTIPTCFICCCCV